MKICILGGGASSVVTIMTILRSVYYAGRNNDIYVTCIHDPSIATLPVGESLSPALHRLLCDTTGYAFQEDKSLFNETRRYGTKFLWESANGKNSTLNYTKKHQHAFGLHVDSSLFASTVLKRLTTAHTNFDIVCDNISCIKQANDLVVLSGDKDTYSFDYVIDCTGFPSEEELSTDAYQYPQNEFVNSVLLYPDFKEYNEDYSYAYVHEDGWTFGVPLRHRKAFGFCYNNKFLSEQDARQKFSQLHNIDTSKVKSLTWKQYYRKKVIDNRILYNGNKLYFFEPHQGIPLHYYHVIMLDFIKYIIMDYNNNDINILMNKRHNELIENTEVLIALNYAGKNNIKSKYWIDAINKSHNILNRSLSFKSWFKNNDDNILYGTHNKFIMNQYIDAYSIDLSTILSTP